MGKRPLRHQNFILSLWQEMGPTPHRPPVWRFSLENPHTAERHGFKELAELAAFLGEWTDVSGERPLDESTNH